MEQENNVKTTSDFKIEIRELNEIHMVYYEFKGPYQDSYNEFGKFMEYVQKKGLPMGQYPLSIFYDDPEKVPAEELRSEPGHMVLGPVEVSDGYKYKKIPASKGVSVRYRSMDEIMPAYKAIAEYLEKNNINAEEFSLEIYYSYDANIIDAEILFLIND